MGDLDTCLDAFKHLPYFKPLYTTILRQQMQYLTEQLSRHAGEESLVLTTNLSSGTISSLTSMYGSGFLDLRSDIKKQFTVHCAKNKMKHERTCNRRNLSFDHKYVNDHTNSSLKRKRPDFQLQYSVTDSYIHSVHITNNQEKLIATENTEEDISQSLTDSSVSNIGIENVRSLQPVDDTASNAQVGKLPENLGAASNLLENDSRNGVKVKEEPLVEESVTTKETDEPYTSDENQENIILITGAESNHLQEEERTPARTEQRKHAVESVPQITDDVEKIRNSYFDNAESTSLSESIITEPDGRDVWIIAGDNNDIDIQEISNNKSYESRVIDKQNCIQIADESKSVGSVVNQTYLNTIDLASTSCTNAPPGGDIGTLQIQAQKLMQSIADAERAKFHCRYCRQSFTTFASRKRHERKHTGETPWACEFCDKKFYRKDDLNVHFLKHRGQKPYMCPICNSGYLKRRMLEAHVVTSHAGVMTSDSLKLLSSPKLEV